MNEKNFEYVKDQVKYTGFGESLENPLREKLQEGSLDFKMDYQAKFGNDLVVASLNFKRSDQSDMYFFNSYDIALKKDNSAEVIKQTIYVNKGNNITLKEAYNLLEGRAVNKDLTNKEGQVYNAWVQMDMKDTDKNGNFKMRQYHQNYGFDLNSAISKHPIKELSNEQDKLRLFDSLRKGNRQVVTLVQNGKEQRHFIEANPQFKTINIYDSNMQRLTSKQVREEQLGKGVKQTQGENAKALEKAHGDVDDGEPAPKAANKRKRKQDNKLV